MCIRDRSSPQLRQLIHVGRGTATEDCDEDRKTDRDLCCCDHHHEQRCDLAFDEAEFVPCSDEREVDRVQHEFDGHEHHEGVASHQNTGCADREEHSGEAHVPADGDGHAPSSDSTSGTAFDPNMASATVPTAAIVSRNTVERNAIVQVPKMASDTVSIVPTRSGLPNAVFPVIHT